MMLLKRMLWIALICAPMTFAQPAGGGGGVTGDGVWRRNALFGEVQTFDGCLAHQPGSGMYHNHVQPVCLRAQLGDNVVALYTGRTGTRYQEKAAPWSHSPILGWSFDGFPIYGPYAYSDPTNAASAVKRVKSSYRVRNITQRTSMPDWALTDHRGVSQNLTSSQYGPDVSANYPLGRYVEDYEFVQGLGDLDAYNGRFAVTPDFPSGTYAYFVTLNDDGSPAFPFLIGPQYYGSAPTTQGPGGNSSVTVPAAAQDYGTSTAAAPQLSSWLTKNSAQTAQVISGYDPSAGAIATWPNNVPNGTRYSGGVTTATPADTQRVRFTNDTVYVNSNGLASYTMGPWFDTAQGGVFMNWPSKINIQAQIPRAPAAASTKARTPMGAVGVLVNGVAIFNALDGASYSNTGKADSAPTVVPAAIHVSAASFEGGPVAPGSIVTAFPLFGSSLATSAASAASAVWPTTLGGATVTVRDSSGTSRPAPIAYASAGQLNYQVPVDTASGYATVTIAAGGTNMTGAINVLDAYPNLFLADSRGGAAGQVFRLRGTQQTVEAIASAIDLGPTGDQVYVVVYATGLGKAGGTATATVGGLDATVAYAGAQGVYPGLDQINVLLPRGLAGKGRVPVVVTAGGKPSNPVYVTLQ
jgi:uncharacterized protein (TIGR03437 family)